MFYVIGLGNPGEKYHYTRHNVAWIVLDELYDEGWYRHGYMNAQVRSSEYGLLIKPETFMNNSGEVISFLKKEVDFAPEHIIIIYDDIDLPLGTIRVSFDRGDGGHNGVKSIVEHLGSKQCIRIRIGISRLLDDGRLVKPSVLGQFGKEERSMITDTIAPQVARILTSITTEGYEVAMNRYNAK